MRKVIVCAAAGLVLLSGLACSGAGAPASPSAIATPSPTLSVGTAQETPIGVTGVIRGLDLRGGTFSLVTRSATRVVRIDSTTQVWRRGTQVRPDMLRDGTTVSIRGVDHGQYVLARTISIS